MKTAGIRAAILSVAARGLVSSVVVAPGPLVLSPSRQVSDVITFIYEYISRGTILFGVIILLLRRR
jgi:hypothetical protein